jgi:hypothetical protein
MGMFDNLKTKKQLPLTDELKALSVNWSDVVFQTKDLDNTLNDYIITEDGDLLCEHVEYEYVYYTEEERKQRGSRPWEIIKETIEKSRYTEKIDFHGKISFYTSETVSETEDAWIDFDAYFIYGKLDKLLLAKVEKFQSSKIKNEKWLDEINKRQNCLSYKLKKRLGWFSFWKSVVFLCNKISYAFQDISLFINRHFF